MEINILLTILLIIISLGGLFLQKGKICIIEEVQINDYVTIKYNLKNALYQEAVKLILRGCYLLNIVTLTNAQKATQTTLNQLQNHKFEG
ncbi:hypothetical protein [Falsiporphyromonas endometrii]|uniref:Uncharacterized protein n=1 Tax=Falsiporphyromonas endometrii TaxID=1387297 RepID=A0ABV9KA61_9PORP